MSSDRATDWSAEHGAATESLFPTVRWPLFANALLDGWRASSGITLRTNLIHDERDALLSDLTSPRRPARPGTLGGI